MKQRAVDAALKIVRSWRIAVAIVLSCACALEAKAAERVDIAAFEYPPIYQEGTEKGLAGDLVVAAFKAVDIAADLRFFPVARMIHYVETGQATCAIGGRVLFEDPRVAPSVEVGGVVLYVIQTFLYDRRRHPAGFGEARLEQLRGLRIGALHSSGILKHLQKTDGLQLVPNTSHEGSAKQLRSGRIDLWAIVDLTGYLTMRTLFGDGANDFEQTASFNRGDVSFVCSRKRDAGGVYIKKFAEGLARIKKNGTYLQIVAKYYGGVKRINPDSLPDDLR